MHARIWRIIHSDQVEVNGGGGLTNILHTHLTSHAAKNVHSIVSQGHITNKIKSCISHAPFYISDGFVVVLGT